MAIVPFLLACCLTGCADPPGPDAVLSLENDRVRIEFDARSGDWIGLVDRLDGSRTEAIAGVREVYREIGLRAPGHAPPDLRSMLLYCGHPGGPPELNYRTYGGFRAIQAYLPTLEALGVDLLWFLPIWEHGDGARWNLYAPFDHFRVSPLYGTEAELRRLSADVARRGVRLMFDLVPHGPPDSTALAREHPEFVARTPDG